MDDDRNSKRPGRPPSGDLESIQTKAWFWYIAVRLNVMKEYSVEKLFRPNYDFPRNEYGERTRTKEYDKYKKGKHMPGPERVAAIDSIVPGSAAWLEHPLWATIKLPYVPKEKVYEIILHLRPEIARLIFKIFPESDRSPYRIYNPENLETELYQYSDIDTFILCIGLMIEAKSENNIDGYCAAAKMTHSIFCRLICEHPFLYVAADLFNYLKTYFYSEIEDIETSWYKSIIEFDVLERIIQNAIVVYMIDKFNLRKYKLASLSSCIYIAEQHLYPETIDYLWKHILNEDIDDPRTHPDIEKIYFDIRKWELKLMTNRV